MTTTPGGMLDAGNSRASYLATLTLEQAEARRDYGGMTQDEWEAYAHVWRTSAVRCSSQLDGYADHPSDPSVALIVAGIPVSCCVTR